MYYRDVFVKLFYQNLVKQSMGTITDEHFLELTCRRFGLMNKRKSKLLGFFCNAEENLANREWFADRSLHGRSIVASPFSSGLTEVSVPCWVDMLNVPFHFDKTVFVDH